MRKILLVTTFLTSVLMGQSFGASATTTTIVSNSKYPVNVEVYKGGNTTCDEKAGKDASSLITGMMKSLGITPDSGTRQDMKTKVVQKYRSIMSADSCEAVGQGTQIPGRASNTAKGNQLDVPAGTWIVAYKDPVDALRIDNKSVNPTPTFFKAIANQTCTLKTSKILGAGDLGLTAECK